MSGEGEWLPVMQGSSLGDFGFLLFKPAVLFIMV